MSGAGAPAEAPLDASGVRLAIVATRWYEHITDALLADALGAAADCKVADPTVLRVPGAFELPVVCASLTARHDAVVALGLVLRGDTPHFEYVCSATSHALADLAIRTGVPVGFGLLTCDNAEQAQARSGLPGSAERKGREATLAALETALMLRALPT
ncbi:MAG TPA: 6,7-dimethyl-8-ribityllumazine synthase [Mycobacteriales bacterium]|nr:6,7-dimethyl-8-ribityllumazine synthase [Mycobacteriales bacterium]